MKSVLISIQPKWCELIASGKKTVEVRKTKPKLGTPFKVYIYCTSSNIHECLMQNESGVKLIGVCNYKTAIPCGGHIANGKVIGEFVCDRIINSFLNNNDGWFVECGCLTPKEIDEYQGDKAILYGWHISDLVIYDKPRELGEFAKPAKTAYDNEGYLLCDGCEFANWNIERVCTIDFCPERMITRPPQSWCYVESENTE